MELTLRKARAEDVPSVMAAFAQARAFIASQGIDQWQDGYPEEALIREDVKAQRGFVLADGDSVAAYTVLITGEEPTYAVVKNGEGWQFGTLYVTIHRIAVADAYRRCGCGKRLLAAAEEMARSEGCRAVRADTHRGNKAMRAFLENNGFCLRGEIKIECRGCDPTRVAYEKRI